MECRFPIPKAQFNPGLKGSQPCGQCFPCRINRRRQWVLRNLLELQDHDTATFLTLTYDEEHVPENSLLAWKPDVTNFLKRLRRKLDLPPEKIRYFGCGEYGSQLGRPHYHLILYGYPPGFYGSPSQKWIEGIWGKGTCTTDDVTPDSIQYVAGYTLEIEYKWDGNFSWVVPPKNYQSNKPGIGARAAERLKIKLDEMDIQHENSSFIADGPYNPINQMEVKKLTSTGSLRANGKLWPMDRYLLKKVYPDYDSPNNGVWEFFSMDDMRELEKRDKRRHVQSKITRAKL